VRPDPSMFYFGQQYMNHPDHRRVGVAFLAAVNPGATTVPLYRAELYDKGFEPHQVKAVLLSLRTNGDFTVDAEGFMDRKLAALRAHDSQLGAWGGLRAGRAAARCWRSLPSTPTRQCPSNGNTG